MTQRSTGDHANNQHRKASHGDGVHLTVGCTQLVSDATVDEIAKTWAIGETAAPAGTPLDPTDGKDASGPQGAAAPPTDPAASTDG